MNDSIIVALIAGGCSIFGTWLTITKKSDEIMLDMKTHNAIQDEKIETLTREVRKHNDFATRVPVLEEKVKQLEKEA